MRSVAVLFVAVLALASSSGCATMFGGNTDVVRLYTTPPYAKAVVDHQSTYGANSTVELDRTSTHNLEFKKDGYVPQTVLVRSEIAPWFWGNFLLGPAFFVGMIVDAATGSVHRLDTNDIRVALQPAPGSALAKHDEAPSGAAGATKTATASATARAAPLERPTSAVTDASAHVRLPAAEEPEPPPTSTPAGPMKGWVLAVMPVIAGANTSLDKELTGSLTDQIRVFFGQRRVRVVDRGVQEAAVAAVVKEEKAKSYRECVDAACQIPLGKALAASHILRTQIARFGRTCTTNAELVDLRAEVTVAAGSAKSDCSAEGMLDAAGVLVDDLVRAPEPARP